MRPHPPMPPNDPQAREREQMATALALMLLLVFGGGFVAFLIFISFGLFLWVIVISACIAVFTGLHYLAWGRSSRVPENTPDDSPPDMSPDWPKKLMDHRITDSEKRSH